MNKQQLASKIWGSANKLRSKIEANEYKDYILGFIFYKFLSDKEIDFLKKNSWTDIDLHELTEEDIDTVEYCQRELGYFISFNNLFSTWLAKGRDFDVSNVTDALSAFNRLIDEHHKKVFNRIFDTLDTGLSKLGDTSGTRTKAISGLLQLIKDIPMNGKQDYDVLGFIYEYLISNFAANAGKKAGEFYTPHEVSLLMSEIVADHLKDREKIEIYDPTSGSGSLLINIGRCLAKHVSNRDNIKYYAQELKENTYNLTRMNLVMRGILPANIVTRNGDTLEEDWPFFDEEHTYSPLYADAVVSNPPYSQHWDPADKGSDPRYSRFGVAPKGKADYAFLLHDLYHIKPNGIMTIVLPHGVLFRPGEESQIRKNLIEQNHIDAIIGLPGDVFFGTPITTIIMVLKQKRSNTDVLFVDASKGFIKSGKNNMLQASNIMKIVDTVIGRKTIDKYSRLVKRNEIRENKYNLNMSRYVDSSADVETWDIYATMFGGIPNREIELLKEYWLAFPFLRNVLFINDSTPYSVLTVSDVKDAIFSSDDVKAFISNFESAFNGFDAYLEDELIDKMLELDISNEEVDISNNIYERIIHVPLVDKYQVYQLLDNEWSKISTDLEIIQTEGFVATKQVDPNMVIKKRDGNEEEVQDGWVGHVIPFELVQSTLLKDKADKLKLKEACLDEISAEYMEILDSFSEEEMDGDFLNDDNTAFVPVGVKAKIKEIYADVESQEIKELYDYLSLLKDNVSKATKLQYITDHTEVDWKALGNSGSLFSKGKVNARIKELQASFSFPEDSFETKMVRVETLMDKEKEIKRESKELAADLHLRTKETIENLSDVQVLGLLKLKWIEPLNASLHDLPITIIKILINSIQKLSEKYATTYMNLESQIKESKQFLSAMISELDGNEFDMKGLAEFKKLLIGE